MKLRQLLEEDDAVSPVIGVILMVAITVILAAVIATFVLGLGEQVSDTAPQASFTFDYEAGASSADCGSPGDGALTITHAGGATLTASEVSTTGSSRSGANVAWDDSSCSTSFGSNSEISAGDGLSFAINNDDTIRVVWTSESGEDSALLADYEGPQA